MPEGEGRNSWSGAPLTLRVYVVGIAASGLTLAAWYQSAVSVFAFGLSLAVAYFLLRRVRWLWLVMVVITVPGPVIYLLSGVVWYNVVLAVVALVLLLAPQTRRYFARDVAVAGF